MKKIIFILIAMLACIGASARIGYKITGNHVPVKTGPGNNYKTERSCRFDNNFIYLDNGAIVTSDGKTKNGYILVYERPSSHPEWDKGWVNAKYLKKVTKCTYCGGVGWFDDVCPDCHGVSSPLGCSCGGSGQKICKKCWGVGFK